MTTTASGGVQDDGARRTASRPQGAGQPDGGPAPQDPRVRQVSERLILIEAGGRRLLTDAACPHRRGRMRYGHLDAERMLLRCPLHHSAFDLDSGGRRVAGPACEALRIVAELPAGAPVPPEDELRRLEGRLDAAD